MPNQPLAMGQLLLQANTVGMISCDAPYGWRLDRLCQQLVTETQQPVAG